MGGPSERAERAESSLLLLRLQTQCKAFQLANHWIMPTSGSERMIGLGSSVIEGGAEDVVTGGGSGVSSPLERSGASGVSSGGSAGSSSVPSSADLKKRRRSVPMAGKSGPLSIFLSLSPSLSVCLKTKLPVTYSYSQSRVW